jgi:hypothetical protein
MQLGRVSNGSSSCGSSVQRVLFVGHRSILGCSRLLRRLFETRLRSVLLRPETAVAGADGVYTNRIYCVIPGGSFLPPVTVGIALDSLGRGKALCRRSSLCVRPVVWLVPVWRCNFSCGVDVSYRKLGRVYLRVCVTACVWSQALQWVTTTASIHMGHLKLAI